MISFPMYFFLGSLVGWSAAKFHTYYEVCSTEAALAIALGCPLSETCQASSPPWLSQKLYSYHQGRT
jgi:hypothetical protein